MSDVQDMTSQMAKELMLGIRDQCGGYCVSVQKDGV